MHIELSNGEADLLKVHLSREIKRLENELIHTDKRSLQHDLAREVDALRTIEKRILEQLR